MNLGVQSNYYYHPETHNFFSESSKLNKNSSKSQFLNAEVLDSSTSQNDVKVSLFSTKTKVIIVALLVVGIAFTFFGSYLLFIKFSLPLATSLITAGGLDLTLVLLFVLLAVKDRKKEEMETRRLFNEKKPKNQSDEFYKSTKTKSQTLEETNEDTKKIRHNNSVRTLRYYSQFTRNPSGSLNIASDTPTVYENARFVRSKVTPNTFSPPEESTTNL